MNDKRTNLEIIAPTVEEAIDKGLNDLGLPRQSVDIEILDEGGKGLFGLGNRQARVRLTIKSETDEPEMETPLERIVNGDSIPAAEQVIEADEEEIDEEPPFLGDDYVLDVARDVVNELLEKMKVRATVTAEYVPTSDARSRIPVRVNVHGDDLSYLIGRQAETLNALQYISSLIINKEIGRSVPLIVDVEGPMPANERRIVHIELRDNPGVNTESVGEDPRRKVTIIPQ
jgi:spoIIIJ-associated protein